MIIQSVYHRCTLLCTTKTSLHIPDCTKQLLITWSWANMYICKHTAMECWKIGPGHVWACCCGLAWECLRRYIRVSVHTCSTWTKLWIRHNNHNKNNNNDDGDDNKNTYYYYYFCCSGGNNGIKRTNPLVYIYFNELLNPACSIR